MDGPGLERHAGTVRRESAAYPRWRSSRTSREAGARAGIQLAKIKSAFPSDIGNMVIIADDRDEDCARGEYGIGTYSTTIADQSAELVMTGSQDGLV